MQNAHVSLKLETLQRMLIDAFAQGFVVGETQFQPEKARLLDEENETHVAKANKVRQRAIIAAANLIAAMLHGA